MANQFQYDLYQIALGVLYVNLGRAGVEFPTTSRAHPSYKVQVTLVPPDGVLDPAHRKFFPFFVRWDIWQKVVAPLFADGSVLVKVLSGTNETLRVQINRSYLLTGDIEGLLAKIQQALVVQLEDQGYVPVGTSPAGFVAPTTAPGEPVVSPGTADGSPYARFDEE